MKNQLNNTNFKINIFISDNKFKFIITIIFILMLYYSEIYNINARPDTTDMLINQGDFLGWKDIGRQGLIFTKLLFGTKYFNPYFAGVAAIITLFIALIYFSALFKYFCNINANISCIFFIIFFTTPIWQEQFYFSLQIFEISISVVLLCLTTFLTFFIFFNKTNLKFILFPINIVAIVWLFSTYQSFVIMYIAMITFIFIFIFRNDCNTHQRATDVYLKLCIYLLLSFGLSFAINNIITKLFFSNSSYLTDNILWGKIGFNQCIENIFEYVSDVVTGNGLFYSTSFIVSSFLAFITIIFDLKSFKNAKLKWLYSLAFVGLEICPFLLTIYSANEPVMRSQMFLPLVTALNFTIALNFFYKYKKINYAIIAIIIVFIMSQAQIIFRLQYTDDIRNMQDMDLASKIALQIQKTTGSTDAKLVFIGEKNADLNPACVVGEIIGHSIFFLNAHVHPYYLHSSKLIIKLFKTLGFNYTEPSEDDISNARKIAKDSPIWPNEKSILYDSQNNLVVIKIGEDPFYEQDFE